jgi:hypothetical protein
MSWAEVFESAEGVEQGVLDQIVGIEEAARARGEAA